MMSSYFCHFYPSPLSSSSVTSSSLECFYTDTKSIFNTNVLANYGWIYFCILNINFVKTQMYSNARILTQCLWHVFSLIAVDPDMRSQYNELLIILPDQTTTVYGYTAKLNRSKVNAFITSVLKLQTEVWFLTWK